MKCLFSVFLPERGQLLHRQSSIFRKNTKPSWEIHALTLLNKSDTCAIRNVYVSVSRVGGDVLFPYNLEWNNNLFPWTHHSRPNRCVYVHLNKPRWNEANPAPSSPDQRVLAYLKVGFTGFLEFGSGDGPLPQPSGSFLYSLLFVAHTQLCKTYSTTYAVTHTHCKVHGYALSLWWCIWLKIFWLSTSHTHIRMSHSRGGNHNLPNFQISKNEPRPLSDNPDFCGDSFPATTVQWRHLCCKVAYIFPLDIHMSDEIIKVDIIQLR